MSLQSKCLYYLSLDGVKIIILSYVVCEHYIVHSYTGSQSSSGPGHVLHIQNVTVQTGSRQALQSVDTNREGNLLKVLIHCFHQALCVMIMSHMKFKIYVGSCIIT